jgi:hypothetical protein
MEGCLYRGELIRCQSDYDNYACSHAKVAMSSGDGMGPSTQVLVARCTWVPEVTSHPVSRISYPKLETPKRGFRGPGCMMSCHTPFQDSGNEASICVRRMFHSHV